MEDQHLVKSTVSQGLGQSFQTSQIDFFISPILYRRKQILQVAQLVAQGHPVYNVTLITLNFKSNTISCKVLGVWKALSPS